MDGHRGAWLACQEIKFEVLHCAVKGLPARPGQAMDLVKEKVIAWAKAHQDRAEVTRACDRGSCQGSDFGVRLGRDDLGQGGLPPALADRGGEGDRVVHHANGCR